jgi:hypothetical protein
MGRQCRELDVTLRIAELTDDSPTLQDAAATWLLGHTERMTFGKPYVEGDALLVDATVHVGCRYLVDSAGETALAAGSEHGRTGVDGGARESGRAGESRQFRCAAHGFTGPMPASSQNGRPAVRRNRGDTFRVVYRGSERWLALPLTRKAQRRRVRALPVLENNPCVGAPCRTADNTRGAACCRDLTLDVVVPEGDVATEQLLRSRKSPYLCKVDRADEAIVECEVISACGYLDPEDGISCVLHDRLLPNHQLAKPSICREWPDLGEDEVGHPGCRLVDGD